MTVSHTQTHTPTHTHTPTPTPTPTLVPTTCIGKRGYTILKKTISMAVQQQIKDDLTVTPHVPGAPQTNDDSQSFLVYRESSNKLYVPVHYGVRHFGNPQKTKLSRGDDISVEFDGSLRESQIPVVAAFVDCVAAANVGGGLLELPCAFGKTCIALKIISQVCKKTLIIVHKEFLMNQWIERIQQFLPTARIGRIQGQTVDIEDKDIVIGMLQSLSMKDYPDGTFDCFGMTVIDEVHHISSRVFSNSLFKIVTPYMMGLSATMNRKDGTTGVFKMFLGDVVFKGCRAEARNVTIRAIEYKSTDPEFNEVALDYRGNVMYSTMISKLCGYNRRCEFILSVLADMVSENSKQQIMILAHNKNILKYFYDAIVHRDIASVGYYIGGMKQAALKETESKQIVIATYSMAAEALDIKTLTTLIMATPKTDIEQSIGRILREKHSDPVVVDIVDAHPNFKSQWNRRKTFYRKENYKIVYTTSTSYEPFSGDCGGAPWKIIFQPKQLKHDSNTAGIDDPLDHTDCPDTINGDAFEGKCFIRFSKTTS